MEQDKNETKQATPVEPVNPLYVGENSVKWAGLKKYAKLSNGTQGQELIDVNGKVYAIPFDVAEKRASIFDEIAEFSAWIADYARLQETKTQAKEAEIIAKLRETFDPAKENCNPVYRAKWGDMRQVSLDVAEYDRIIAENARLRGLSVARLDSIKNEMVTMVTSSEIARQLRSLTIDAMGMPVSGVVKSASEKTPATPARVKPDDNAPHKVYSTKDATWPLFKGSRQSCVDYANAYLESKKQAKCTSVSHFARHAILIEPVNPSQQNPSPVV